MATRPLFRIKRCCLNAPAIYKTLRSRANPHSVRAERLYVIVGLTHDAVIIYTKGALRRFAGEDYFYIFISAKRSVGDD